MNDHCIPRKIDPLIMVSHWIDSGEMKKLNKRFDARDKRDGLMKVFVKTKFSRPQAKGAPTLTTLT